MTAILLADVRGTCAANAGLCRCYRCFDERVVKRFLGGGRFSMAGLVRFATTHNLLSSSTVSTAFVSGSGVGGSYSPLPDDSTSSADISVCAIYQGMALVLVGYLATSALCFMNELIIRMSFLKRHPEGSERDRARLPGFDAFVSEEVLILLLFASLVLSG